MKKQLLITFILIIFGFITYAQPGTIDLSFNSSDLGFGNGDGANSGILNAKVQNDGKIIIVGGFTSYNGTLINRIARINIDGTIDLSFNAGTGANGSISTTSIQSDGKIIIGGSFTSYNGTSINRIARLNNNGSLDLTFNPSSGPSGDPLGFSIDQTSIQIDGKIIIGGDFTSYNGTSRNRIARLNSDGSLDTTFNPGTGITTGSSIYSISLQSDGKIIIGGNFSTYNGISSKNIARLNINGTLDNTFNVGTGASSSIRNTSIQNDGKIIVGGGFTSYNGTASNYIARLNIDGSIDNTFNIGTGASGTVRACSIQSDGKIIISGDFTSYNAISVPKVARINPDGTLDNGFDTGTGLLANATGNQVNCISILNDGKILLTGNFKFVNDLWRNTIAFLDSNGLLNNINHGFGVQGGSVSIVKKYGSDKTIIAGNFYAYNGIMRRGLAILNNDGSLDLSFNPGNGFGTSTVSDIEVVNDKIIITGNFTSYNGISANKIIRLNSDGSKDTSFNIGFGPNLNINTIANIGNNKFLIGGNFTSYNGTNINKIARINYDGSIDTSFNPQNIGSAGTINFIEIINNLSYDKYVAVGNFTCNGYNNTVICGFTNTGGIFPSFGVGQSGDVVNALLYDGSKINYSINSTFRQTINAVDIASAYDIPLNGPIYSMSKQSDGKIIIGGDFTVYNGTSLNYIARINSNGTIDNTFNIGNGANSKVSATSIQSDGKIIIGGDFISYNGTGRNRIARINGDNTLSTNLFNKNTLVIYPNPSNGIYTLQTNEMKATKSISIYTLLGQKIYDAVISSNEITIDISNQPKGVYFYKVIGEEGETKSGKLVIE
jgi:uncharacterized delta-60 repeat protein